MKEDHIPTQEKWINVQNHFGSIGSPQKTDTALCIYYIGELPRTVNPVSLYHTLPSGTRQDDGRRLTLYDVLGVVRVVRSVFRTEGRCRQLVEGWKGRKKNHPPVVDTATGAF